MIAAAKLLRCLQMISMLKHHKMTIREIADRFDMTSRSAYRYLDLLREVGYEVEGDSRKQHRRYSITGESIFR